ncbi:helix-turn-helix domain-containing protein [Micromonospora sp. WMMD987]|uniref:helix-turn-helix domain-containing protein n=1 Tax=Micromonospora sp. WMMD987 TaxID=3016089 RepID=UPI00249A2E7A|nr:helix-turn-helix domain-containing protein [Micromonospora sp. WMMD987]WFE97668.1 helix-turn-helix domain-containing protein [Micromonospora sp. WMMD987]
MDGSEMLPVGRRVAYWRGRRRLSQQVFADRLGKSKSWVDKVERGVRTLDKVSTLQDIAGVLRIDTSVLLGRDVPPAEVTGQVEGVGRVREALSTYDVVVGRPTAPGKALSADRLAREVSLAWSTFQHARYPPLTGMLPGLVVAAQRVHADDPVAGRSVLVQAYRLTASLLVKLGELDLAWLAADRAMSTATGDAVLVATVTVQLGQVLRASGRARMARSTALAAAYRIAPPDLDDAPAAELSLCGTLVVQAALAAARDGDDHTTAELLDEAAGMAARVGDGHDHHRTAFGPVAVDLARVAAALDLGDAGTAVVWHEKTVARDGWRWLPAEHRAAHLLDAARAYLHVGDPGNAARALLAAERTAPDEVRYRPAARAVLTQVAHDPHAPATIVQLAAALTVS